MRTMSRSWTWSSSSSSSLNLKLANVANLTVIHYAKLSSVCHIISSPFYRFFTSQATLDLLQLVCMGLTPFHTRLALSTFFLHFLAQHSHVLLDFQTVAHHCCNLYKLPSLQQVIVLRIYFGRIGSSALCTYDNSARHFPLAFPCSVRKWHGHMGYRFWGLPWESFIGHPKVTSILYWICKQLLITFFEHLSLTPTCYSWETLICPI